MAANYWQMNLFTCYIYNFLNFHVLLWLFYYGDPVLRFTSSLYLPVGAGVAQKMWDWATLQIPLWNFHVSRFRKPQTPVVPWTRLGTNIFQGGGPCHYLFSKEEPLSQIHWSSGLYKLIATGPKPSVMLNLLPSTRALGELCNLVWSNRRLTWSPWAHFHQSQVETPHGSCSIFWGMQSPIKSSSLLVSG